MNSRASPASSWSVASPGHQAQPCRGGNWPRQKILSDLVRSSQIYRNLSAFMVSVFVWLSRLRSGPLQRVDMIYSQSNSCPSSLDNFRMEGICKLTRMYSIVQSMFLCTSWTENENVRWFHHKSTRWSCSTVRKPALSSTLSFSQIILHLAPSTRHLPTLSGKCEGWRVHSTDCIVPVWITKPQRSPNLFR